MNHLSEGALSFPGRFEQRVASELIGTFGVGVLETAGISMPNL